MAHVLFFTGDDYEDLELWYPLLRCREAGHRTTVAGAEKERVYRGKHGYPSRADAAIEGLRAGDFDGVVVPGGWLPDKLRRDPHVLALVRALAGEGRLVAAICHGGWVPVSAGVYRGVRVTGSPGIKDDLVNAGALYEDAPVVADRNFVSSRRPDDLPEFMRAVLAALGERR